MELIKKHGFLYHTADVVLNVIIIIAIVAAIRTFLVSPFQVEGSSMINTLEDNQYIVINKLAYHIGSPER
ncbi:MAG: S26 family signal peptidase, partial [Candidatus Peribacteraceae bacterium]|nr:S26 family signal peptidase [Candidatus Peribacteraceae bacterium]